MIICTILSVPGVYQYVTWTILQNCDTRTVHLTFALVKKSVVLHILLVHGVPKRAFELLSTLPIIIALAPADHGNPKTEGDRNFKFVFRPPPPRSNAYFES